MHIHASLIAICGINIQGSSVDNSSLAITTFVLGHVHDHVYSYISITQVRTSNEFRFTEIGVCAGGLA